MFAKCFQAGSWDRACYRLLCVSSCFLLPLYHGVGTDPRSGHFDIPQPLACALCVLTAPRPPRLCLSCPWPAALQAWHCPSSPRAQPAPVLLGNGFSVAPPGTRCHSGPSWWLSSAQSPTPPCLPPSEEVSWAAPPHYAQGSFSCSSLAPGLLRPCFVPGTLPCHLPSYHTWFKSPSQPQSFTPPNSLCFQNNTRSQLPSAALPVLPPLSAPKALCCPHTSTTPPTSSVDSMSPVCLSTNWAQSHVLYHDCLVAHKKLNTDTGQTSVICGLFSKDEHSVYALLSREIYLSICQWNEVQYKISSITMLRWFQGWQVSTPTCYDSLSISSVANFTWLFSKFFFYGLIFLDLDWVH